MSRKIPKNFNGKFPRISMKKSQEFQFEARTQMFAARFARSLSHFVDACRHLSKCETGKEYRCAWMSVLFLSGFVTVCRGEQSSVPSLRTLLDRVLPMFVALCRCLSSFVDVCRLSIEFHTKLRRFEALSAKERKKIAASAICTRRNK